MSTLVRYILSEQLRMLAITLGGLLGVLLMADAVEQMRFFIAHHAPLSSAFEYFLLRIPGMVYLVLPFALLLATVLTLGMLASHSEITAMRAAGISLGRISMPILATGLAATLFLFWMVQAPMPRANAMAQRILNAVGSDKEGATLVTSNNIWFRVGDRTLYGIQTAELGQGLMGGVRIIEMENGGISRFTVANTMVYRNHRWLLEKGYTIDYRAEPLAMLPFTERPAPLDRSPAELGNVAVRYDQLSTQRLSEYVQRLTADGYDAKQYQVELASRTAYPFVCLIMVMVALPHAMASARGHAMTRGLGVCLLIAAGYWLIDAMSYALGKTGTLPFQLSAWLSPLTFTMYAMYRLLKVRA